MGEILALASQLWRNGGFRFKQLHRRQGQVTSKYLEELNNGCWSGGFVQGNTEGGGVNATEINLIDQGAIANRIGLVAHSHGQGIKERRFWHPKA